MIAVRVFRIRVATEILQLAGTVRGVTQDIRSQPITFSDLRGVAPVSQDVADMWCREMRSFNPLVARSGILLDRTNETFNLQFERVVRCSYNPQRRIFYDANELSKWLADGASTPAELASLHRWMTFLPWP